MMRWKCRWDTTTVGYVDTGVQTGESFFQPAQISSMRLRESDRCQRRRQNSSPDLIEIAFSWCTVGAADCRRRAAAVQVPRRLRRRCVSWKRQRVVTHLIRLEEQRRRRCSFASTDDEQD